MTRRGPREDGYERRKPLSKKQRARLFLERGGRCHACRRKIRAGEKWIDEHYIALSNFGTNAWDNRCLTCYDCFVPKNRKDAKQGSKRRRIQKDNAIHAQRMADKSNRIAVDVRGDMGERSRHGTAPARKRNSRPMACGKDSPFKRKLNGKTVRR